MRNILTALLASVLLACAGAAHAGIITYTANLNGISESPPNASPGTGFATVTIDDILNTMRVQVTFSGLLGPTTASHIHCCTGVPGAGIAGVATTVPNFDGFPLGVMSGTYDKTLDLLLPSSYNGSFVSANGGTAASAEAALLAGMAAGRSYLNVHSTFALGGEIRGFLTPVSEPTGFALLALGGVMLLLARRHRSYRS
jgi:hypothetical protein